jgi:elongation factor G
MLVEQLRDTFGNECLPINLPAKGRSHGGRLLLQSQRRGGLLQRGRRAPAHHRPGGRDQRGRDGPLSGGRRGRPVRAGTARRLRTVPARGPPGADLLRLRAQRRRRQGTARPVREADAESGEANPPLFVKGSGSDAEPFRTEPDAESTSSPTCSRSSTIPSSASSACSAFTRARCAATPSCSSTTARSRSRSASVQAQGQGPRRDRGRDPGRHRGGGQDRGHPLRCGAARQPRRGPDPPQADQLSRSRCSAWPSNRCTRARSRSSPTRWAQLAEEDPCFRIEHHKELNETVIRGLGELHLRVMLERMKERYGVEVTTRPPRIAYRETISGECRRPPPPQEADRRRRPVRRGVPAGRTAAARRWLRVRRRGQGRHHPGPVPAGHREGRAPGAGDTARSPATSCTMCA